MVCDQCFIKQVFAMNDTISAHKNQESLKSLYLNILSNKKKISKLIVTSVFNKDCKVLFVRIPQHFSNFRFIDSLENSNIEKPRSVRLTVRCVHA